MTRHRGSDDEVRFDLVGTEVSDAAWRNALRDVIAGGTTDPVVRRELLGRIARHCAELPRLDDRAPSAILGLDDSDVPR